MTTPYGNTLLCHRLFVCICSVLRLNHIGARIARPPRLWKVCGIWRTAYTPPRTLSRQPPALPGIASKLFPPQAAQEEPIREPQSSRCALLCNSSLHLVEPPAGRAQLRLQVQCCTLVGAIRKTKLSAYMKRKDPPIRAGLFFSWNPATSYSPRSSPTKYHRR